jgi:FADH2 O2-dependent halogenase
MSELNLRAEIVVVGSGFGGSLISMILRQLGYDVLLVDRDQHPRFAIGESTTPLTNLLLEKISRDFNLPELLPLCSWGEWQRFYPELPVGLKRGFSFYFPEDKPLHVAASPNDEVADTHWYRPAFDAWLVDRAKERQVVLQGGVHLNHCSVGPDRVQLSGTQSGQPWKAQADFLIDATGPRGFLFNQLKLPELDLEFTPPQRAIFTHFTNVPGFSAPSGYPPPPYSPSAAAVHHCFPGGWIWMLQFNNGITSAGASLRHTGNGPAPTASEEWKQLLECNPILRAQFAEANAVEPWRTLRKLAFRCTNFVGQRYILLPAAAGFVDPLLSTGFALNLLGILRLAEGFRETATTTRSPSPHLLQEYERSTTADLRAAEMLVGTMLKHLDRPQIFRGLSKLYFAAASFTEVSVRLGSLLKPSFLLRDNKEFFDAVQLICRKAASPLNSTDEKALLAEIHETIEPINIAGLTRRDREVSYPVDFDDLIQNASKVGSTPDAVRRWLRSSGFLVNEGEAGGNFEISSNSGSLGR